MGFTILALNPNKGDRDAAVVRFDVDGAEQHISGLPLDDRDTLLLALHDYEQAYETGLQVSAAVEAPKEVLSLVGDVAVASDVATLVADRAEQARLAAEAEAARLAAEAEAQAQTQAQAALETPEVAAEREG